MSVSHGQETLFCQAVRECQWERVRQLVLQGCSLEQRDLAVSQAVTHSQWWLVSQLVQLGVSQQHRDLAVHKAARYLLTLGAGPDTQELALTAALEHGQWEVVLQVPGFGVRQELVQRVFQQAVGQEKWEHVPSLVTLQNSPELTGFVLQEAIKACQWGCVRQLVRHGLSPDHQRLVCKEALDSAHWDCALELLRQGCEPACAESVVLEAFRWNRCQDLVGLLREEGIRPGVRDVILGTAQKHEKWDEYMMILKGAGALEKETVDLVTLALHTANVLVILRLLSLFACARRVFKQVLLKTRFSDHSITILHAGLVADHPGLVFYMFVAQEMWDSVLSMFRDDRVGNSERCFALKRAVRKRAWKVAKKITRTRVLSHGDRRYCFLQAARQGKWKVALKLSGYTRSISVGDKVFALRTWLQRGLWDCLETVDDLWILALGTWRDADSETFYRCIVEESVIAEKFKHFRYAFDKMFGMFSKTFSDFVFSTALKNNKHNYVLWILNCYKSSFQFERAFEHVVAGKRWGLVIDLIEGFGQYIDYFCDEQDEFDTKIHTLQECTEAILLDEDAWPVVVPALDTFCGTITAEEYTRETRDDASGSESLQNITRLIEWCVASSHWNVGLLLSVMNNVTDTARNIANDACVSVRSNVFCLCFRTAIRNSSWESAAAFLQHLSAEYVEDVVSYLEGGAEYSHLIEQCRETDQYKWAVYIGGFAKQWDNMNSDLEHCEDTSVVDFAVRSAASEYKWDIVQNQLPRCSQNSGLLGHVLECAVRGGHSEVSSTLFQRVDLSQSGYSIRSLAHGAVTAAGDREHMVKLCIRYGLSTHLEKCGCVSRNGCWCYPPLPMHTVLKNGQLPLVKLLYKAGACSNQQLFLHTQDTGLRTQLQGQNRQDIVQYLDQAATTPRTLQDLCRLQVSHLIGCHPGRQDRVARLGSSLTGPAIRPV